MRGLFKNIILILTRRRFLESRKNYTNFVIGNVDRGFYWKTIILENLWKIILFVEWKSIYVPLFKSIVLIEKPFMSWKRWWIYVTVDSGNCGCSFVAKLRWKKKIFFLKKYLFFTKYTLFAEKIFLYGKKVLYWKMFWLKIFFFYRKKYKWKCKKYISHLRNIFPCREYLRYK